jgi:hypothetical protein
MKFARGCRSIAPVPSTSSAGKTLARYAYESRAGKRAPALTKAHFEDTNGQVLMSYSAIELNDDADEPAPEPDEPAPSRKKRRSKSKDG